MCQSRALKNYIRIAITWLMYYIGDIHSAISVKQKRTSRFSRLRLQIPSSILVRSNQNGWQNGRALFGFFRGRIFDWTTVVAIDGQWQNRVPSKSRNPATYSVPLFVPLHKLVLLNHRINTYHWRSLDTTRHSIYDRQRSSPCCWLIHTYSIHWTKLSVSSKMSWTSSHWQK